MALTVSPISALTDNYIWCIHDDRHAWIIDPGSSAEVIQFLHQQQLTLVGILITHHHWDHTDGIAPLAQQYPSLTVIGPYSDKIQGLTRQVAEGDTIALTPLACTLQVLEVPGHTLDHIAYYNNEWLFCGDTLFSGGCGRLFEGSAEQMHQSLQKFTALPAQTAVYCAHEYTNANLTFAVAVEPLNPELLAYQQTCILIRQQHKPTLPSTIGQECSINPFLRCNIPAIATSIEQHSQHHQPNNVSRFAALRRWKDLF